MAEAAGLEYSADVAQLRKTCIDELQSLRVEHVGRVLSLGQTVAAAVRFHTQLPDGRRLTEDGCKLVAAASASIVNFSV